MRNLHKTLELLNAESPMDYCEEFDKLKSALEYCDSHFLPFKKLHFRGGNEQIILDISDRIQKILVEHDLVNEETKEPIPKKFAVLRKITLFLFMNTDVSYKYNLRDDANLVHIVELCPLLPKFILLHLIWSLKLDRFFYEALSYSPCWFAFQYFDAACDSLKYIKNCFEVLEKVENLIRAIIINLARSHKRYMDVVDTKIIYGKLYEYTINILRLFYTPDAEKFKSFSQDDLFKYSGFAIKHLLDVTKLAFDVYENNDTANFLPEYEIYDICPNHGTTRSVDNSENNENQMKLLKEQQLKIISALLNSLQYNIMLVNVESFMYWVEIDLMPTKTLQLYNAEMMYCISERIKANEAFNHDVQQQLKLLAIRPKTVEELAQDATLGEILRTLSADLEFNEKCIWFNELFKRPIVFGNDECLGTIKDNIKLINKQHCKSIIDFIKLHRSANDEIPDINIEAYDDLVEIIVLGMQNFTMDDVLEVLKYETDAFGSSTSVCCREDFQNRAVEAFNKLNEGFDLQNFLILCFENPERMWTMLFDAALQNVENQINFCEAVRKSRPFSNLYFEKLLIDAVSNDAILREKHFPQFLYTIYFQCYYPECLDDFLKTFVNRNVEDYINYSNYESLFSIVKLLNLITEHENPSGVSNMNLGESAPPVLLIVAQIMEHCRWDFLTYSALREEIVQRCIRIVELACKNFYPAAAEKDRQWIKQKMKTNFRSYTQYYFQLFTIRRELETPMEFTNFLLKEKDAQDMKLSVFLLMHIVRCTDTEIRMLVEKEALRSKIDSVLLKLGEVAAEKQNANATNNFRRCVILYASIIKNNMLTVYQNDETKMEGLATTLLQILKRTPEEIYENLFVDLEPLILEIMQKCKITAGGSILNIMDNLKECTPKSILMSKLKGNI